MTHDTMLAEEWKKKVERTAKAEIKTAEYLAAGEAYKAMF